MRQLSTAKCRSIRTCRRECFAKCSRTTPRLSTIGGWVSLNSKYGNNRAELEKLNDGGFIHYWLLQGFVSTWPYASPDGSTGRTNNWREIGRSVKNYLWNSINYPTMEQSWSIGRVKTGKGYVLRVACIRQNPIPVRYSYPERHCQKPTTVANSAQPWRKEPFIKIWRKRSLPSAPYQVNRNRWNATAAKAIRQRLYQVDELAARVYTAPKSCHQELLRIAASTVGAGNIVKYMNWWRISDE